MAPRIGQISALRRRDTVALPAKLLQTIPTCAQQCVSAEVNASFVPSQCKSSTDAVCLCSHYSNSGYTLGEIALACLYSHCSQPAREASSKNVFNICSANSQAVSPTHSVMTLTTMGASSSTDVISTSTPVTETTQTTIVSTEQSSQATPAANTVTTIFTPAAASTSTSSSSTSSAAPTQSPNPLTTGQTVGIAVASIAIAALLFGLCFFCCCCVRRRRKDKTADKVPKKWLEKGDGLDFKDASSPTGSRFPSKGHTGPATSTPEGPARPPRSFQNSPNKSVTSSGSSSKKSNGMSLNGPFRPELRPQIQWWRQTSQPEINRVPPGLESQRGSIFFESKETRVTPKKNGANQQKRSPKIPAPIINVTLNLKDAGRQLRPDSAATGYTRFEEEDHQSPLHKKMLPALPCSPGPARLPPINAPLGPSFADHFTTSPEDMTKQGLTLQIPRKPLKHNELPLPHGISANTGISTMDHLSMPPTSASSYLPAYYTSNDSRTPIAPRWSPRDNEPRFSQPQFVPKPLGSRRGLRSSWASATTFESVDPDETTPENEDDKQLSPVAYPKVPRPSNQAIPRSSPSTVSQASGNTERGIRKRPTLFSKRRGENLSLDLGRGLMISNIDGEQGKPRGRESPLEGHNKGTTAKGEKPQMELKSPLWEPKLTPSRRGDDLYLSVELKER